MHIEPGFILVGLVVGLFVGASGVGGGSLTTPLLIIIAGVKPLIAVGTDLLYSVPTKLLGAWVHHKQKTAAPGIVAPLCIGGIPGALVGVGILAFVRHSLPLGAVNAIVRHGVAVALFIAAIAMVVTSIVRRGKPPAERDAPPPRAQLVAVGAVVGLCVAITSIGSGALTLPLLYAIVPYVALRRLVGADVMFGAALVPLAALGHVGLGDIDYALCVNLLIGSLPGVYLGSKLCRWLPDTWLRPAVATILIFAGSRLI